MFFFGTILNQNNTTLQPRELVPNVGGVLSLLI